MESTERAELERLLFGLAARIDLPAREKRAMLADFRAAAEYLISEGVPAREAAERLGCERLGDFYLRRADYWYPLDDAAKIYPMSMTDGWMSVFRLSAYMDAPVVPELLQAALHFVLPRFPFFSTEVRRGLFWHYIDGVKRRFVVRPETEPPCAPMDLTAGERQAFRVVYYRERISVEFFHILTDGTGGLAFLTALVSEYLRLLGLSDEQGATAETPPDGEECESAFERCCGEAPCGGFAERPAVQLRGRLSKQRPARVLHLELDATVLRWLQRRAARRSRRWCWPSSRRQRTRRPSPRGGRYGYRCPSTCASSAHLPRCATSRCTAPSPRPGRKRATRRALRANLRVS